MLFFNASPLLPSGATNLWPLQTGSMRVSGPKKTICCQFSFSVFFTPPYIPTSTASLRLCLYPCPRLQLQNSPLRCMRPSPFPPRNTPLHLVLSVKLPIPVSRVPITSRRRDLHLRSLSCQCSSRRVTTRFDRPVCLVSLSYSPPLLDAAMVSPPVGGGPMSAWHPIRGVATKTGFSRSITSDRKRICCQVLHFSAGAKVHWRMLRLSRSRLMFHLHVCVRKMRGFWLNGFQLIGRELNED